MTSNEMIKQFEREMERIKNGGFPIPIEAFDNVPHLTDRSKKVMEIGEILKDFPDKTVRFKELFQEIIARSFEQVNFRKFVGIRYLVNQNGFCDYCHVQS